MVGFNRGNPFAGFSGFGGKNAAPMRMPVQQIGRLTPPVQKIGAGSVSLGMPNLSIPTRPQQPAFPPPASLPEFSTRPAPMPGPTYNGRPVASMPEFSTRPAPTPMAATYNGRKVAPMSDEPQIEDPPLPPAEPAKKKLSLVERMARNIKWAAKNGGRNPAAAGIAALMGVPMYHRNPGGDWMAVDPGRHSIYPMGTTPYFGPGAAGYGNGNGNGDGGGDDTTDDPNALPGDKYKKNLIPEWWKDWYRTQGQYGGVPPVDGLL